MRRPSRRPRPERSRRSPRAPSARPRPAPQRSAGAAHGALRERASLRYRGAAGSHWLRLEIAACRAGGVARRASARAVEKELALGGQSTPRVCRSNSLTPSSGLEAVICVEKSPAARPHRRSCGAGEARAPRDRTNSEVSELPGVPSSIRCRDGRRSPPPLSAARAANRPRRWAVEHGEDATAAGRHRIPVLTVLSGGAINGGQWRRGAVPTAVAVRWKDRSRRVAGAGRAGRVSSHSSLCLRLRPRRGRPDDAARARRCACARRAATASIPSLELADERRARQTLLQERQATPVMRPSRSLVCALSRGVSRRW